MCGKKRNLTRKENKVTLDEREEENNINDLETIEQMLNTSSLVKFENKVSKRIETSLSCFRLAVSTHELAVRGQEISKAENGFLCDSLA